MGIAAAIYCLFCLGCFVYCFSGLSMLNSMYGCGCINRKGEVQCVYILMFLASAFSLSILLVHVCPVCVHCV